MSVISRLQRLTGEDLKAPGRENGGQTKAEELVRLRTRIDAILSRRPEGQRTEAQSTGRGRCVPLEELVPGEETTNEAGAFFCACHLAGDSERHGRFCIQDLAPLDMDRLAVLGNDPALRGLDYREALFFDTETTGIAGGTGTVAFLIGLGWFEGNAFITRQLFARDYGEERAMLLGLRELVKGKRFLVSFNGKAFDSNLLATRFIMNRMPDPLSGLPHLDLLHPARRLLSHRLPDCRLGSLEAVLLGFERKGDVPGREIPQRYFDWLRRRDGRLMADVFKHNRLDILSLAALAAHLSEVLDPDGENTRCHPGDRLAAARLFLARGCPGEAIRLLDPLVGCASQETARDAARELSLHYKRAEQWPAAVAIWEELSVRNGNDLFALIELAKWCEHKRRDFTRALALVERACACERTPSPDECTDLAHRRERLERKLAGRKAAQ
ncbi:ribonuclease H-like domain-containing protein [Thermodesulfobacteriota bacterium]